MSLEAYQKFLDSKQVLAPAVGFDVAIPQLNSSLFPWQAKIVQWALDKGKAALFQSTGTGKTLEQGAWADQVCSKSGGDVLITSPLCVSGQTHRELARFGIDSTLCRTQDDVKRGINITNYDMLQHFTPSRFKGIVLDESSRMKQRQGKTTINLIERFAKTPYKLCASATPAPNSHDELGSHSEFLDVLTKSQMLAMYFEHDGGNTSKWELKGHARKPFWKFMASWAVCLNMPSDIGGDDAGFILEPLNLQECIVQVDQSVATEGCLFRAPDMSSTGLHKEMRLTAEDRAKKVVELIKANPTEQWLIWTNTDHDADVITAMMPEILEVRGSDPRWKKEAAIEGFQAGNIAYLLSKPSIFGAGLNLQCCHNMAFYGLSYCHDETTEILSRDGWKRFGDLQSGVPVASVNPTTQLFEWQVPTSIVWDDYQGDMLHFVGSTSDAMVTPNHRMWVKQDPLRYKTLKSVDGKPLNSGEWHIRTAEWLEQNARDREYRMATAPKGWIGVTPPKNILIPSSPMVDYGKAKTKRIGSIPSDVFARFAGWYLSEGCVRTSRGEIDGVITISQTKIKHRPEIIETLAAIGIPVNHQGKDMYICNRELAIFMANEFGMRCANLHIPRWVLEWDTPHLQLLWDGIMDGDGMHMDGNLRGLKSTSRLLLDDSQELGLKLGISVSADPTKDYTCIRSAYTEPSIRAGANRVPYAGKIGCVSVPNGLIITRRNGKPMVGGNSFEQLWQAIRRCWRYGQKYVVNAYIVIAETEGPVLEAQKRKQRQFEELQVGMVEAMRAEQLQLKRTATRYDHNMPITIPSWLRSEAA
jgi:hypothetical protein